MTSWRDDYLAGCRKIIREQGHMIQAVGAPGEWSGTEFSYTVGLGRRLGHDFAISGLPPEMAQAILNRAADKVHEVESGLYVEGLIDRWPLLMRRALNLSVFKIVRALYPQQPLVVYQLLFPDALGKFPGQEGYSLAPVDQRLL